MNNLIITIISIALVAVALIAGAYYGGVAYSNAQINATANSIMNEAQQILYAERLWSTNNNQPDISGMGPETAIGTGMSALVNGHELSEWPSFGGTIGMSASLSNPGPQPSGAGSTVTTGAYDYGCYSINGYYGLFDRTIFSVNNENYVVYAFQINFPYTPGCTNSTGAFVTSSTDVSQIGHPIVKIAKAINAAINQIPANAITTAMPYIGLPEPPAGSATINSVGSITFYDASGGGYAGGQVFATASGTVQTDYCYLDGTAFFSVDTIVCVFGPS